MSLYNMLFGKNSNTGIILAMIGLKEWDIERFRDCGIYDGKICIYTRTGGGNREGYPNKILTNNPYYEYDEDDDYDSTYATYYFSIPKEIADDVKGLSDVETYGISGNFIKWVNKTLLREPTESDEKQKARIKSKQVFDNLIYNGDVTYPHNGHTCIILSDSGAEACFKMAEQGEMYYNACPLKMDIIYNDYKYKWVKEKGGVGQYRIAIQPEKDWSIDIDAAERYLRLFAEKYPKGTAYFQECWRR
jgi:hypothetical protein